jgi:hypothetical protein
VERKLKAGPFHRLHQGHLVEEDLSTQTQAWKRKHLLIVNQSRETTRHRGQFYQDSWANHVRDRVAFLAIQAEWPTERCVQFVDRVPSMSEFVASVSVAEPAHDFVDTVLHPGP